MSFTDPLHQCRTSPNPSLVDLFEDPLPQADLHTSYPGPPPQEPLCIPLILIPSLLAPAETKWHLDTFLDRMYPAASSSCRGRASSGGKRAWEDGGFEILSEAFTLFLTRTTTFSDLDATLRSALVLPRKRIHEFCGAGAIEISWSIVGYYFLREDPDITRIPVPGSKRRKIEVRVPFRPHVAEKKIWDEAVRLRGWRVEVRVVEWPTVHGALSLQPGWRQRVRERQKEGPIGGRKREGFERFGPLLGRAEGMTGQMLEVVVGENGRD